MAKKASYFSLMGIEAPELVVKLVEMHPEIRYLKFQEYSPHALGVTEQLRSEPEISVSNLIRHRPDAGEYAIQLSCFDINSMKLRELIAKSLTREKALVLCSKVEMQDDETLHIPMLDFECSVSASNLNKIKDFISELDHAGAILESGRSYHYYGFELLTNARWVKFMARTLLFTGFVDIRHIGHRLLSGEARLRLAKIDGSDRYLMTPRVVAVVE